MEMKQAEKGERNGNL